ncbi:MAG: hypothetical protein K9G38_04730 [Bacteroidales bacterium]|nr:hypothetical protein [Bacteroidales bacterium]
MKNNVRSVCTVLLLLFFGLFLQAQKLPKDFIYPRRPAEPLNVNVDQVYYDLVNKTAEIDWTRLDGTLEYVSAEYDCSDFRLVNLVRILYEFRESIPSDYLRKIEEVLFNFRYWWDEPGGNSMCYWSENHQILFATAEYLIGQLYPDQVFHNSGLTGREHMEKARIRAEDWFEMRWNYGFIEYNSNVYYKEDIGPLVNLVDFAEDPEMVTKAKMMLDLIFYDMAVQSIDSMFITVSGRAYKQNRVGLEAADFAGLTHYLWGNGEEIGPGIMYGLMVSDNYELPPVIREIALDKNTVIIKQCNGLDLTELKDEGYYGTDNRSMMMQWGMEAFTNPVIIRNSMKHIRNYDMFTNDFISDFRSIDFFLLRWFHLEPMVARILNPQYNGVAIQKGNTYTYKTPDYMLYTVQSHQPGDYADQQHVFGMNVGSHFSIFHNHPAREKDVNASSPNYWVGYGHFPHSVQDRNINLSVYKIPRKKGIMESALLDYTRAFFPSELFDTAFIDGNYAFGKKDDTYCGIITSGPLAFRDGYTDDLVLEGKKSFWITEAGSAKDDGSFEAFVTRVKNNEIQFDDRKLYLTYVSGGRKLELEFGKDFMIDGEVVNTDYSRYDSPYAQAEKKDRTLTFTHRGKSLFLDFENMEREY